MRKGVILTVLFLLILSIFIVISTAQPIQQAQLINQGSNFETQCTNDICNTTIYSYDKYFNQNGVWEEIDESWHTCQEGFCTNNYHFQAIANSNGLISIESDNLDFTQQITSFYNNNISLSSTPITEGNTLTYEDIIPNVDLRYQYLPHKIKEELIINQPLENLVQENLEITFTISNNNIQIEDPFICDNNRKCRNVEYDLSNNEISLLIPSNFLTNETTIYPVIIDPSIYLGNSSIIWNGFVEETLSDDGMFLIYPRFSNPSSIHIGLIDGGEGSSRGDIDWNFNSIPNLGEINNAFIYLYAESFTGPNFLNITQIEKNSSQWANTNPGNEQFFYDMRNGSVYSSIYTPVSGGNLGLSLYFSQQGLDDINTALNGDKRFSVGLDTDYYQNVTISARDHPTQNQRPVLYLEHTIEDYTLQYDANGNMISGFGKYMEYDAWNRLSKIRQTNSTGRIISEYLYDHNSNRIKKTVYNPYGNGHNESTYYMNTRPGDFIQVRNTNGTIINETYIYLQDKLIAKYDSQGKKFFYHPDHLGSTSLVTNESGDVVEDLLYLPYGDVLNVQEEISRFTYTGQEKDQESDFMNYDARTYYAKFGRFLQCDSVKPDIYDPQLLNCYAYVRNNPYKYTDPTGNILDTVVDVGFIGYDIYTIIQDSSNSANWIALAADAGGAIIPGVTGLGIAVRTAKGADKALELATTADKLSDGVKGVNQLENAKDAERVANAGGDYSKFQENAQRGRTSETFTLSEEGLSKNTRSFGATLSSGENVNTIPDSLGKTGNDIVEIKDTQRVSYTKQLQAQSEIAKQKGTTATLITGQLTKISQNVRNNFNIIRRNFLGPRRT